jgi:DNA-binding response OmpR family regulator
MAKILLVEDDLVIADMLKYYLENSDAGYKIILARTGGEAFSYAIESFDLILMDILLPDVNGISLCERLRDWHNCPIIFISCLDDSNTIIKALSKGGDDFITKPFDNKVLEARIQANLRRARINLEDTPKMALQCGTFSLDLSSHAVVKEGQVISLSPIEFKILAYMMKNRNQYFTGRQLYKVVWGQDSFGDIRTLTVHIHNLRIKIEENPANPKYLKNIWGKGYVFNTK